MEREDFYLFEPLTEKGSEELAFTDLQSGYDDPFDMNYQNGGEDAGKEEKKKKTDPERRISVNLSLDIDIASGTLTINTTNEEFVLILIKNLLGLATLDDAATIQRNFNVSFTSDPDMDNDPKIVNDSIIRNKSFTLGMPIRLYYRIIGQTLDPTLGVKSKFSEAYKEIFDKFDKVQTEYRLGYPEFERIAAQVIAENADKDRETDRLASDFYSNEEYSSTRTSLQHWRIIYPELQLKSYGRFGELLKKYPHVNYSYGGFGPSDQRILDDIMIYYRDKYTEDQREAIKSYVLTSYYKSSTIAIGSIMHNDLYKEGRLAKDLRGAEFEADLLRFDAAKEVKVPRVILDKWADAKTDVIALNSFLSSDKMPDKITADRWKKEIRAFYSEYIPVLQDKEETTTIVVPVQGAQPSSITLPKYLPTDYKNFDSEISNAVSNKDWEKIRDRFIETSKLMDEWITDLLKGKEKKDESAAFETASLTASNLDKLHSRHPNAVKVNAVFVPHQTIQQYRGQQKKDRFTDDELHQQSYPLLFYIYKEKGKLVLEDLSDPKEPKKNEVEGNNFRDLFGELDSSERFPQGVVYWRVPESWLTDTEQVGYTEVTGDWELSDWLRAIGIGLLVVAVGAATAGTGTLATVLFVASSAVSIAGEIASMSEKSEQGTLDEHDVFISSLIIVTDLATIVTAGAGRIVKSSVMQTGRMAKLANVMDAVYVVSNATAVYGNAFLAMTIAADLLPKVADELKAIQDSKMSEGEKRDAAFRIATHLIATGLITYMAFRNMTPPLGRNKNIALDLDLLGRPFARPHMEFDEVLEKLEKQGSHSMKKLGDDIFNDISLSADVRGSLKEELAVFLYTGKIPAADIKRALKTINTQRIAGQENKIMDAIAELRQANRIIATGSIMEASEVRINVNVPGNGIVKIKVGNVEKSVNLEPLSEADLLYIAKDGKIHVHEVKKTAAALRGKLKEKGAKQAKNLLEWESKGANFGEKREIKVVVENEEKWTEIFRDITDEKTVIKFLIENKLPLQISHYTISASQLKDLASKVDQKLETLSEAERMIFFTEKISSIEKAKKYLNWNL